MITTQVRAGLSIGFGFVLLLAVIYLFYRDWSRERELAQLRSVASEAQAIGNATEQGVATLDAQLGEQHRVQIVVTDRRAQLAQAEEELRREDETVAHWAAQPVPLQLRELDRAAGPPADRSSDSAGWRESLIEASRGRGEDQAPGRRSDEW